MTMNDVNLTTERRHEIRYDVQQYFIPEMVECVKDGYLPFIALFPSAQWYSNLRMDYDIEELKAAKVDNFGFDDHIRLSYAISMEQIKKGLDRIEQFIKDVK